MKLLLIIVAVLGATVGPLCAQGIIWFGNESFPPISIRLPDQTARLAIAGDNLFIGVFYGPAGAGVDSLIMAPGLAVISPEPGIMANAPRNFPLPGIEPGQVVSLQIRAWDAALGADGGQHARDAWRGWPNVLPDCNVSGQFYGETKVSQFVLGFPDFGVGTRIWQSPSGLNPDRFTPLQVVVCPEPSTLVLAALGGLGWLLFLRRRKQREWVRPVAVPC